jgi:hypothetical protein
MTPQDCVLDAVLRAQGLLAQYIEPGPHDCAQTLNRLFLIFDDRELASAVNILTLETVGAAMAADTPRRSPTSPLYNRTNG